MERKVLFIKDGGIHVKLPIQEIQYVKSNKNYLEIHLRENRYIVRSQLALFTSSLPTYFVRVHRRYLVNIFAISNYSTTQITIGKTQIPVSKTYRKAFLNTIS